MSFNIDGEIKIDDEETIFTEADMYRAFHLGRRNGNVKVIKNNPNPWKQNEFMTRDEYRERFLNKTRPKIFVKEIDESTLHVWCDSYYDLEIKSIAGVFNVTDLRKNLGYLSVMIDPRYDYKEIVSYILHM